jgi:hypothetical protein
MAEHTQFAAMLTLILLPFTLAGGFATSWKTAKIIIMLVIGILLVPVFAIWEKKYAKFPVIPGKVSPSPLYTPQLTSDRPLPTVLSSAVLVSLSA